MSEIETVSLESVLGNREAGVKIERSWSEDVPSNGAGVEVVEPNRTSLIKQALARPSGRRATIGVAQPFVETVTNVQPISKNYHFFAIKGKRIELIGTKEFPAEKFAKDLSGRFYREWLKQSFPGRKDYEDICVWNDATPLKEIVELLGLVE